MCKQEALPLEITASVMYWAEYILFWKSLNDLFASMHCNYYKTEITLITMVRDSGLCVIDHVLCIVSVQNTRVECQSVRASVYVIVL